MTSNAKRSSSTAVPVDLLRPGVYVVELDRPWTETPFLFQGFRISSENELETLRKYCRFVYADLKRSHSSSVEEMRQDARRLRQQRRDSPAAASESAPAKAEPSTQPTATAAGPAPASQPRWELPKPAPRPSERARQKSVGTLTKPVPHPDRKRFSVLVQHAHAVRHDAHEVVGHSLRTAAESETFDVAEARSAAEEMAATVMEDPTAALWLTHLRDRDRYLESHSVNVCILSLAVGHHLGMERGQLLQLGLGALLHAIGRVHIPREILDKPGELSQPEWDLVRRYPETGYNMVANSGGVPLLAREVVRRHQERWAGQGYPEGKLGDDIPQMALIAGIADAYDAMTTDRPYRAAMTPEDALNILYKNAQHQFGEAVVQAFMRVIGAFPVGSVVELDNSALGMVVGLKPGSGLWPTVLMLRTPDGTPYEKRLLLNLAASEGASNGLSGRRIRGARSPGPLGIDTTAIIFREFGLANAA